MVAVRHAGADADAVVAAGVGGSTEYLSRRLLRRGEQVNAREPGQSEQRFQLLRRRILLPLTHVGLPDQLAQLVEHCPQCGPAVLDRVPLLIPGGGEDLAALLQLGLEPVEEGVRLLRGLREVLEDRQHRRHLRRPRFEVAAVDHDVGPVRELEDYGPDQGGLPELG